MSIVLSVILLLATVFALVTAITTDESEVKHLPKVAWILLIVFVPLVGAIGWFAVGREWNRPGFGTFGDLRRSEKTQDSSPEPSIEELDDDAAIEAAIEAEIQFHEKQAEIRRLEAEVQRKRNADSR